MFNRIIRILATAAGCALLLAGCSLRLDPAPVTDGAISFSAGSALLLDDAKDTKSGEIKSAFEVGDVIFVWGAKTISSTKYTVFSGDAVSLEEDNGNPLLDVWDYTSHRFWDSNASQYDFMAITGPTSASAVTCDPANPGPMQATVSYNVLDTQCDLMAACHQRNPVTIDRVGFEFQHLLSAVSVKIVNDSPTLPVQLNYYGFKFIGTSAECMLRQSGNGLANISTGNWLNPAGYSSTVALGMKGFDPAVSFATLVKPSDVDYESPADPENPKYNFYPTSTIYDMMIPQELDLTNPGIPQLVISYEYNDGEDHEIVTPVYLRDIKVRGSEDKIVRWEPGKKYSYEIHIRLGGGINVTVTTTDWEDVIAETPGLAIQ